MARDEVILAVIIRGVDLDDREPDAETIRAGVQNDLQQVGWDAEVSLDATILSED